MEEKEREKKKATEERERKGKGDQGYPPDLRKIIKRNIKAGKLGQDGTSLIFTS